jgi:hypothetical protein
MKSLPHGRPEAWALASKLQITQLDNVCFLNRPVGVKRFQISLFRVKQHPKIQIATYVTMERLR